MRIRSLSVILMLALVVVAGCDSTPPAVVYIVLSPTPSGEAVTETDVTAQPTELTPEATSVTSASTPSSAVTLTMPTPSPNGTAASLATSAANRNIVPTPTFAQIQIAEQPFENGRMFWLRPNDQVWIMVETGDGRGEWYVTQDLFEEGDVEFDPDIVPPDEELLQPIRGFGAIWRNGITTESGEQIDVRELIGWAVLPERGVVTDYEYQPGGEVVDGEYVAGSGFHFLTSVYGPRFRFNEANSTWQTVNE